jgi:ArsR family transcriptional regulator, arsenate/arsenite/antimonite-responsive transcriptional repressor / arsenate reductase (thioredoxin)
VGQVSQLLLSQYRLTNMSSVPVRAVQPTKEPNISDEVVRRAELHAVLGEPVRLAIVDELALSDRAPSELSERFGLPTNLLAHHLSMLERAGLVERLVSAGDRRRRYIRLAPEALARLGERPAGTTGSALFVCTHNSARSQLAAALWRRLTGLGARSAGTEPAEGVHPGALAAAARRGLDLAGATPRLLTVDDFVDAELVVTVCDRAHEEVDLPPSALHWSIPDPVSAPEPDAFDRAVDALEMRMLPMWRSAPDDQRDPVPEPHELHPTEA